MNIQYDIKLDNEIKNLFFNHPLTAGKILKSKKNKHLLKYVMDCTYFLTDVTIATRMFYVIHHSTEQIKCLTCGKLLKYHNVKNRNAKKFRDAFNRFCCPRCECLHEDTKKVLKQTNLKKYGCEWSFQSKNNIDKSKQTMLNKYGCEYAQQNKDIKNKSYKTMQERYGVIVSSQSFELSQKIKKTRYETEYKKFLENKFVIPLFSIDDYIKYGNLFLYKWKCLQCGTEFLSMRNEVWFKQGAVKSYARCETCYPYNEPKSQKEKDVQIFLQDVLKQKIDSNNRTIIPPKELDIYIPEKKIAIEFDGLYWHSDELGISKNYHLNKTLECEKHGIQLIHIFENEWKCKQDIVKSRLKNLLGIYDKTVYARKCQVKEVDSKTSKEFQEENHIQGSVNAKVNLGLYFNDELISLMTFGKCRFDKKHEWELLRFCNKLGYHIPGGASKLLKYFERNYNPKSLVSYADRRWSQGKVYEKLGFTFSHASAPNYWYWKTMVLESRVKYQKHKLKNLLEKFDQTKTEIENMRDNGYKRIFDCGNLVYEKKYIF